MVGAAPAPVSTRLASAKEALRAADLTAVRSVIGELLAETKRQLAPGGESKPEWFEGALDLILATDCTMATEERIEVLLACVQWFYNQNKSPLAILAADKAVELASSIGAKPQLRRAYTSLGAAYTMTKATAQATFAYVKAYELARDLDDRAALCQVIGNLAAARSAAGLFEHCLMLNNKVLEIAGDAEDVVAHRVQALTNNALACDRMADFRQGLSFMKRAEAIWREPVSQLAAHDRVKMEYIYVKLLVSVGDVAKARERVLLAQKYAELSNTKLATLQATLAESMTEVHDPRGEMLVDIGLSRLHQLYDSARTNEPARIDVLEAMQKAYTQAGDHAKARRYNEEYLNSVSKGQLDLAKRQITALRNAFLSPQGATAADVAVLPNEVRQFVQGASLSARTTEHLESMAILAELRDDSTGVHAYRVGRLAAMLATSAGFADDRAKAIGMAARLHDLGKLVVPDAVLRKRDKLTPGETASMRRHAAAGHALLADVEHAAFKLAAEIAHHHHQWWDGSESGYPEKLSGTDIPIESRITALADVYDALTHERPYKAAWTHAQAIREIRRLAGRQFEPELAQTFCALADRLFAQHGVSLDAYLGQDANSPMVDANRVVEEIISTVKAQAAES